MCFENFNKFVKNLLGNSHMSTKRGIGGKH